MNYVLSEKTKKSLDGLIANERIDLTSQGRGKRPGMPSRGGSSGSIPAKIKSKSGIYYVCDLYGSGIDSPATATDQKVFVLQLNLAETLPVDSWIMVSLSQVGATGGGNVP